MWRGYATCGRLGDAADTCQTPAGHSEEDTVGRSTRVAITALAIASLGLAGCGSDATDAVRSVRSEASGAAAQARASLQGEIDRAQVRVDDLVQEAKDRGVPTDRLRTQADKALKQARAQADRAIAEAKAGGRDQAEIERLKADARKRLDALQERIDSALGGR